ncbi:hypothetical protein [Microbacterium sp. gxy059]|uniref:hypothetical protein n=1 Tax=Microbacterium sp. gxy059 TaxID=2957199 RepID=UPI003D971BF4
MTTTTEQPASAVRRPAPDRFMRRLLGVRETDVKAARGAERAFRTSLIVTAIRCLITYLAIPILVPIVAFAEVVAVPLSLALCLFALVNGVISLRRFWISNHRYRWMYTAFMAVVFVTLAVAIALDVTRLVTV